MTLAGLAKETQTTVVVPTPMFTSMEPVGEAGFLIYLPVSREGLT